MNDSNFVEVDISMRECNLFEGRIVIYKQVAQEYSVTYNSKRTVLDPGKPWIWLQQSLITAVAKQVESVLYQLRGTSFAYQNHAVLDDHMYIFDAAYGYR